MKQKQAFLTITRKEFFSYLNSATAYVVMVPFLVLSVFLFFRSAMMMNDANLRPFVELLPWFLMVIGPALAMKAFADEKRRETTELLFAHPVSEWTVVAGKYAGLMLFYGVMLAATLPLPITLAIFAQPDPGVMIGQYIGMISVGGVFLASGLAASASDWQCGGQLFGGGGT
jgi:ABC-2 type transport system permease protein